MAYSVRELNLAKDGEVLSKFLREHMGPRCTLERSRWLGENPDGLMRAWALHLPDASTFAGVAAAIPRRVRVAGRTLVCYQLADFALSPEHRSLGPAVLLQRACLEAVVTAESPFCFDFPSRTMVAVHRRCGVDVTGGLLRLAKPLRVDRKVRSVIANEHLARVVSIPGNWALRLSDIFRRAGSGGVGYGEPEFPGEFNLLGEKVGSGADVVGCRTAEYLEWRYQRSPLDKFDLLTIRDGGRLLGYGVVRVSAGDATIMEHEVVDDSLRPRLLSAIVERTRDCGIVTLSCSELEGSSWLPVLRRLGFRERESAPFVVHASADWEWSTTVRDPARWYVTLGDGEL